MVKRLLLLFVMLTVPFSLSAERQYTEEQKQIISHWNNIAFKFAQVNAANTILECGFDGEVLGAALKQATANMPPVVRSEILGRAITAYMNLVQHSEFRKLVRKNTNCKDVGVQFDNVTK